jgi:hypothetical protein
MALTASPAWWLRLVSSLTVLSLLQLLRRRSPFSQLRAHARLLRLAAKPAQPTFLADSFDFPA